MRSRLGNRTIKGLPSRLRFLSSRISELRAKPMMSMMGVINTFLLTALALAGFFLAFAQYRLSREQAKIAESLAQLEFAKTTAKFDFERSEDLVRIELTPPTKRLYDLVLPRRVRFAAVSGVRSVRRADGPIWASLEILEVGYRAIELRGFYVETSEDEITLSEEYMPILTALLTALQEHTSFYVMGLEPTMVVTYDDVLGQVQSKHYRIPRGTEMAAQASKIATVTLWPVAGRHMHLLLDDPESASEGLATAVREANQVANGVAAPQWRARRTLDTRTPAQ